MYNSRIREKQETIEQFWQGAEKLGFQKLLIQYPGMHVRDHNFYTAVATLSVNCMHLLTTAIHS